MCGLLLDRGWEQGLHDFRRWLRDDWAYTTGGCFIAAELHQLFQQLTMYIEVAHGRGRATNLLKHTPPPGGGFLKSLVLPPPCAFTLDCLHHGLHTPCAGPQVVDRIDIR